MKIHTGWAYSHNEAQIIKDNHAAFDAILEKIGGFDKLKLTYTGRSRSSYTYRVEALNEEAKQLTALEAALIMDGGNLCFGGRFHGKDGVYYGTIHTD